MVAGVAVSGLLVGVPALNSSAANKAATACPEALPTDKAVDGLKGTGYTVEKGNKADPFSAVVLGRITDGIQPGTDMIIADLDSPALTRAGGVWSGMSGSPVYTADKKLIGSVSYTLIAGNTNIAGITPAADMLALRNDPSENARRAGSGTEANEKVAVSAALAARIAKTGEATSAEALKGFRTVSTPLSVTGVAKTKKENKFLKQLEDKSGVPVKTSTGSSAGTKADSSPNEIFAGSNYVAAMSYGDITAGGVGTTTFVCDDTAVAWGHPFLSNGPVGYSMHPAQALFIQPDPSFSAFKVANPGGVVGTVTWDGTVGLRGTLGEKPDYQIPVTTSLTNDAGKKFSGKTVSLYEPFTADFAALHVQSAVIKALGAQSAGSSEVKITIKGTRADGEKFKITHENYFADTYDVSYPTADKVWSLVYPLVSQPYEDLKITGIDVSGEVSTKINQFSVNKVETKEGKTWVPLKDVEVSPGATLPVRATLKGYRSSDEKRTLNLNLTVPEESTSGSSGWLSVQAGDSDWYYDEQKAAEEGEDPDALDELIEELNNLPAGNSVSSQLTLYSEDGEGEPLTTSRTKEVDGAVAWYYNEFSVSVK
ncbi:SpoIVB peptidase S55 domain-containing protein [Kineosporia babensis]